LKPYVGNRKTYSDIRYIFGPNSFFQILFVLLEIAHFKGTDGSENENEQKMDLARSPLDPSYLHDKFEKKWKKSVVA
jgi:hypothetical protein